MTRPITKGDWVCSVFKQAGRDIDNAFLVEEVGKNQDGFPILRLKHLRGGGLSWSPSINWMTVKTFEERIAERLME